MIQFTIKCCFQNKCSDYYFFNRLLFWLPLLETLKASIIRPFQEKFHLKRWTSKNNIRNGEILKFFFVKTWMSYRERVGGQKSLFSSKAFDSFRQNELPLRSHLGVTFSLNFFGKNQECWSCRDLSLLEWNHCTIKYCFSNTLIESVDHLKIECSLVFEYDLWFVYPLYHILGWY